MSFLRLAVAEGQAEASVSLAGELDLAELESAKEAIEASLASPGRVTIDLSALEFVDLAGAALLRAFTARDHGHEVVVLASRSAGVNRVLRFAGLAPVEADSSRPDTPEDRRAP